jgi:hypothetical protein
VQAITQNLFSYLSGNSFQPAAIRGNKKFGTQGGCTHELLDELQLPEEIAKSLAELGNLGVAKSTWNSYKTAQQMLMKCEKDTGEKMNIPINDRQILIFVNWLARTRGLKAATISTYLSGIRQLHIVKGIEPPIIRTGLVKLVLKGIENMQGISKRAEHLTGRLPMTTNVMMLFRKLVSNSDMHTADKALIWRIPHPRITLQSRIIFRPRF